MQKKTKLIIVGALLIVSGFYAITQQATTAAERASRSSEPPAPSDPDFVPDIDLGAPQKVDRNSWEVLGEHARKPENAWINRPEHKKAREDAALSIENPVKFRMRFPKDAKEKRDEQEHLDEMTNPIDYEPIIQARKTREQLEDEAWSEDTIMNPQNHQNTEGTTP